MVGEREEKGQRFRGLFTAINCRGVERGSVGDIGSSDGGDTVYARPRDSREGGDGIEK